MLFKQITADIKQALIDKNDIKKNLLRTLKGDLEGSMKLGDNGNKIPPADAEVIAAIKSFIKRNEFSQERASGRDKSILETEWAILDSYLPKQLTRDEIRGIAKKLLTDCIDNPPAGEPYAKIGFGDIMKYLKEKHNGAYDGKLAAEVVKEVMNP